MQVKTSDCGSSEPDTRRCCVVLLCAVYRVGTLLEMVRDMATALALDGKRVKVCVQAAMGQGVFQVGNIYSRWNAADLVKVCGRPPWGRVSAGYLPSRA